MPDILIELDCSLCGCSFRFWLDEDSEISDSVNDMGCPDCGSYHGLSLLEVTP